MAQNKYGENTDFPSPSPVLLRRRLSAPEIIMRKHTLAQQKSESTESESTLDSTSSTFRHYYGRSFWNRTSNTGSESNLSSRKLTKTLRQDRIEQDSMRKHTLLRRTWNREQGHLSADNPASAESPSIHQVRTIAASTQDSEDDSKAGNASIPKRTSITQESRVSTCASINSTSFYSSSTDMRTPTSPSSSASAPQSQSARDSAYNNSRSRASVTSVLPRSSPNSETSLPLYVTSVATSTIASDAAGGSDSNATVNVVSNLNVNATTVNLIVRNVGEDTATPTAKAVELERHCAQGSFYLKRNEDVHVTPDHCRLIKYMLSNIRAGSIYGKPHGEPPVVVPRYSALPRSASMEVNPSSPSPDADAGSDRESDSASLVDSLDDPSSPRQSACRSHCVTRRTHDDRPVRGDLSALLPDNSPAAPEKNGLPRDGGRTDLERTRGTPHSRSKLQKAAAFFIPMVPVQFTGIDQDASVKTVAERMPEKVRDRLDKRKLKFDQKFNLKPIHISNCDDTNANRTVGSQVRIKNGNNINIVTKKPFKIDKKNNKALSLKVNNSTDVNFNSISIRKSRRTNKQIKRKYVTSENSEMSSSSSPRDVVRDGISGAIVTKAALANQRQPNGTFPRVEALPIASHQQAHPDKKVEILEITEEISNGPVFHHSPRSRIPVPVSVSVPISAPVLGSPKKQDHSSVGVRQHGAYGARVARVVDADPKTDQLIANLLIDSLNNIEKSEVTPQTCDLSKRAENFEKRPHHTLSSQHSAHQSNGNSNWYRQKFEMIPEEKTSMSQGSSNEELSKPTTVNNLLNSVEVETQVESRELHGEQPNISDIKTSSRGNVSLIDASSQTDAVPAPIPRVAETVLVEAPASVQAPKLDQMRAQPQPQTQPRAQPQPQPVNKGKAALGNSRDGGANSDANSDADATTIPKGWVTFYMLRKAPDSPSSSTDEGIIRLSEVDATASTEKNKPNADTEVGELNKATMIKRKLGIKEKSATNNDSGENRNSIDSNNSAKALITSSSFQETSGHESEKKSACPSLPLSSYLPLRKNRRLNQRKSRFRVSHGPWPMSGSMSSPMSLPIRVPGEWSVTVSGTNSCGQPVPDLEMHLKFPTSQATSQSDSGFGEEHPLGNAAKCRRPRPEVPPIFLPPAAPASYTVITKKRTKSHDFIEKDLLNDKSFHYLPDLIKNKNQRIITKRQELDQRKEQGKDKGPEKARSAIAAGVASGTRMPALPLPLPLPPPSSHPRPPPPLPLSGAATCRARPRQTLTSYRRFSLHHSSHLPPQLRMLTDMANFHPRDIIELPECFTGRLAVMGSAIRSDNRFDNRFDTRFDTRSENHLDNHLNPRLPTITKRDLNKNYHFEQYPT